MELGATKSAHEGEFRFVCLAQYVAPAVVVVFRPSIPIRRPEYHHRFLIS